MPSFFSKFLKGNIFACNVKISHDAEYLFFFSTFAPFWNVLKTLAEKISMLHLQLVHSLNDLIKDVGRYNDEQSKKNKTVCSCELEVNRSV